MALPPDFAAFRALSARLGRDPLRVQGPGGNTSIKEGGTMWIKASGTELADAETHDIFVAVDRAAALAEAEGDGDGSCRTTVLDPAVTLRPSIETTFHAALDWPVVAHSHSIAALVHGVGARGRAEAAQKLAAFDAAFVPYAKPGLPLTRKIRARATPQTNVFVLENHGLICCGNSVAALGDLIEAVEAALYMPILRGTDALPDVPAPRGFAWAAQSWIARDARATRRAVAGSYYPDHVVFLGPALPRADHDGQPPAVLVPDTGVALRRGARASQAAMLRCLGDLLARLPDGWEPDVLGPEAEAELMVWDAETYRQALATRQ